MFNEMLLDGPEEVDDGTKDDPAGGVKVEFEPRVLVAGAG